MKIVTEYLTLKTFNLLDKGDFQDHDFLKNTLEKSLQTNRIIKKYKYIQIVDN